MAEASPPAGFRPSFSNCQDGVTDLCPVEATIYGSYLSIPGNAVLVAVFSICTLFQIGTAIHTRTRTYSYSICLLIGTLLELLGYTGRLLLHQDPWNFAAFAMQMCSLIVGPAFIAAAMSVTFKHLVIYTGARHSLLKPRLYPWIFVGTDFASIAVQGLGGGIASAGSSDDGGDTSLLDIGDSLLLAGVAFQVANMVACGLLMLWFVWRYKRAQKATTTATTTPAPAPENEDTDYAADRHARPATAQGHFRAFCYALVAAYLAVLARCIYRLPEFASGWGSELQQNETTFLILDGAMIAAAVLVLTVARPGWLFPAMERYSRSKKTRAREAAEKEREREKGKADDAVGGEELRRDEGRGVGAAV